jgi:CubicO group peptidase (beta-lactamase class C family)
MNCGIGTVIIAVVCGGLLAPTYAADVAPTDAQIKAGKRAAAVSPEAAIVFGWVDAGGARVVVDGKGPGDKPLDGDSVFEIGSASKVFTCVALAEMVTKGEVKLDDPVARYVPASVRVPSRGG